MLLRRVEQAAFMNTLNVPRRRLAWVTLVESYGSQTQGGLGVFKIFSKCHWL